MRECDVRTPEQALAYITDCNLATVQEMASNKSRKKHEYQRQIAIAQRAIDWMIEMGVSMDTTRAADITTTVKEWAKGYER